MHPINNPFLWMWFEYSVPSSKNVDEPINNSIIIDSVILLSCKKNA